jgi:hypothetical protein
MTDRKPDPRREAHKEAVRLSWKSRHIPFGTLLLSVVLLAAILSAVFMIIGQ